MRLGVLLPSSNFFSATIIRTCAGSTLDSGSELDRVIAFVSAISIVCEMALRFQFTFSVSFRVYSFGWEEIE